MDVDKRVLDGNLLANNTTLPVKESDNVFTLSLHNRYLYLNKELLSKHILLLGGIGTGKTNTILGMMSQLPDDRNSVCMIFDTKGDFFKFFRRNQDILISTDRKYCKITNYFNIFKEIRAYSSDQEEQRTFIREIAEILFADRKNESQPFFSNGARMIFVNIVILLNENSIEHQDPYAYYQSHHDLSNKTIWDFFENHSDEEIAGILKKAKFKNTESILGDGKNKQALGVMGELRSMVEDYFCDAFHYSDPMRDISIMDTIRKKNGTRIFIEYDLTKGEVLAPVYSLLFEFAFKEALGRKKSEGDCYFIMDELKLLPYSKSLPDALNFGRSFGVKMICGIQNVNQIYEKYGEEAAKSLLSGFMNVIVFYLLDYESRKYVIDNFGENYLNYHFLTNSTKPLDVQKIAHCVEDHDILSLKEKGEAIVKISGYEAVKVRFKKYD